MATDQNDQLLALIADRLGEIIKRLPKPPPEPSADGPQPISEPDLRPGDQQVTRLPPGRAPDLPASKKAARKPKRST